MKRGRRKAQKRSGKQAVPPQQHSYESIKWYALLFAVVVAAIFLFSRQKPESFDLNKTLAEMAKLDGKYNTSWHGERLAVKMVPLDRIPGIVEDYTRLHKRVSAGVSEQNISKLDWIVLYRISMLNSQRYYQETLAYGDAGIVSFYVKGLDVIINETINCSDKDAIVNTANLLSLAVQHANRANNVMDGVLQDWQLAQEVIGVGQKRPEFYRSPLGVLSMQAKINNNAVRAACGRNSLYT